jgi:hypothetical protein
MVVLDSASKAKMYVGRKIRFKYVNHFRKMLTTASLPNSTGQGRKLSFNILKNKCKK